MNPDIKYELNNEDDFRFRWGFNKGFSQAWKKIDYCLFLSENAKILYRNISGYVYDGKECNPPQDLLRLGLRWSKQRLTDSLNELRDKGLIITRNKGWGTSLVYYFPELYRVNIIIHSELVWEIAKKHFWKEKDVFQSLLSKYEDTQLYIDVNNSNDPREYQNEIEKWFLLESGKVESTNKGEQLKQEKVTEPKSDILPTPIKIDDSIKLEKENGRSVKSRDYRKVPVEEWNAIHLVNYFRDCYFERFKVGYYGVNGKDSHLMKEVLTARGNSEVIKNHIDIYMQLEQFPTKTVPGFCSAYVQAFLDRLAQEGAIPEEEIKQSQLLSSDFDSKFYQRS